MIIRDMIAEDIPQLAVLYKQFWNEESSIESMYENFCKFHEDDSYLLLSAVENNQLIGSVMGIICGELYGDCKPFMVLENMIVDNKYRNHGVGKALISELEKKAFENNCSQIILVTDTNRIDACKFYESAGYNPDTHKGYKKKLK
ncbi:GNAT family N-acetyltransferase [Desulfosporosinus nitroreducens]|uniref:GNAT family N-acetyltransferase n=1 Tax=Desulfosporosinus nitroreducens TaxID=2018668 RepID=A0ABT8QVT7_9FIRM|nr:GNAT family N-acetyltransferase [Desulfosporosinus nitroreducens]MCO1603554.1 GNAT family N-acetyltransferase [Desulfosporosinus nitroreducens]MDO0825459.1 GNAT family N-acetyltransferase [Desulfosporosinus nitroreducens]